MRLLSAMNHCFFSFFVPWHFFAKGGREVLGLATTHNNIININNGTIMTNNNVIISRTTRATTNINNSRSTTTNSRTSNSNIIDPFFLYTGSCFAFVVPLFSLSFFAPFAICCTRVDVTWIINSLLRAHMFVVVVLGVVVSVIRYCP